MSNLQIPNLFNNITTTAELTKLDENFQQIADHVNTNFNSLETIESTQSLTANGYQKLPGGLMIQWGTYTTTQTGNEPAVLDTAFPTPFTTACFSMSAVTYNSNLTVDGDTGVNFNSTTFGIRRRTSAGLTLSWIAIGY